MRRVADFEIVVVGAGVVGLAVAAELAPRHPELLILERHERHGSETSSRNSEVIHAGMYYPTGSLKARLCVEGNRRVYELCARHAIPHRRLGKLIVAVRAEEEPELERLLERGTRNGVELRLLSGAEARELEPNVPARSALLSPSTGIVSAHGLMDALLQRALAAGALLQARSELVAVERRGADYRLEVRTPAGVESVTSERVVNAAGLECDRVAALFGIDVDAAGYRLHYCKGSYFAVTPAKAGLLSRLVYPVPSAVSLGVHALPDLGGRLRFGPDVEFLPDRRCDYSVDPGKRPAFAEAVRRLVPSLRDEDLLPDMAGVRPKLQAPGEPPRDFVVADESARGLAGLVDLVGIESPGLTAAPALGALVAKLLA
jgi:L-2-hydroxyglutarate oxidase LhgO